MAQTNDSQEKKEGRSQIMSASDLYEKYLRAAVNKDRYVTATGPNKPSRPVQCSSPQK